MNNEILKDAQFIRENCRKIDEWGYWTFKNRNKPLHIIPDSDKFIIIPEAIIVALVYCVLLAVSGENDDDISRIIGVLLLLELPMFILSKISKQRMVITQVISGFFLVPISGDIVYWGMNLKRFERVKTQLVIFIVIAYLIFIIRYAFEVYNKLHNKKIISETRGTITEKMYNVMQKYDFAKYFDGKDNLDFWKNYIKEMDTLVQYPHLDYIGFNVEHKSQLLQSHLNTKLFQQILMKQGNESFTELRKCFDNTGETFKVQNHIHEKYLICIKELASSMPNFPCSIPSLNKLCSDPVLIPLSEGKQLTVEAPNFTKCMGKYNDLIKHLIDLYSKYKSNLVRFNSDYKGTIIGESGERAVLEELKFFSNQMKILTNIRLEVNGQSVESDIICVCPQGIFALEVKNLGSTGSYNITVEKDGLWKKVMKNGRWKAMGSVSKQNLRHLHGIEQVVNSRMNNSIENWITARSIIVFANDVIGIRNYSDNVIVRASEMMSEIRKYPQCLNAKQIDQIAYILQKESLPPKKYETENWGQSIIGLRLEIIEKTNQLLTTIKPCLDIINSYATIPDYKEPFDYKASEEVFDVSLADDISDYRKSEAEIAQARKEAEEEERRLEEIRRREEEDEYFTDTNYKSEDDQMWEDYMLSHDEGRYNIYR